MRPYHSRKGKKFRHVEYHHLYLSLFHHYICEKDVTQSVSLRSLTLLNLYLICTSQTDASKQWEIPKPRLFFAILLYLWVCYHSPNIMFFNPASWSSWWRIVEIELTVTPSFIWMRIHRVFLLFVMNTTSLYFRYLSLFPIHSVTFKNKTRWAIVCDLLQSLRLS